MLWQTFTPVRLSQIFARCFLHHRLVTTQKVKERNICRRLLEWWEVICPFGPANDESLSVCWIEGNGYRDVRGTPGYGESGIFHSRKVGKQGVGAWIGVKRLISCRRQIKWGGFHRMPSVTTRSMSQTFNFWWKANVIPCSLWKPDSA